MTRNQVEYAKLLESKRAAQASEALTASRDANAHYIASITAAETERAHRAQEAYNVQYLGEVVRSNQAREGLQLQAQQETQRSNLAREAEAHRANIAAEAERHRANVASELELNRAHLASEAELYRSHTQSEYLTQRQQDIQKQYYQQQIGLGYSQLSEQQRANKAREQETHRANLTHERQQTAALLEQQAQNRASNQLRSEELAERQRAAIEQERLQARRNDISYLQTGIAYAQQQTAEERLELDRTREQHEYELNKVRQFQGIAGGLNDISKLIQTWLP